ncbi:MAG: lactate utilization protein [Methanobrevibacter thaueri]|jgi:L-lactate dehydrogenase complex protein LldG|uniref:LUD domain-containing protein n=1 Tax=Methanobrevibacter thaueri TaxID=190975 RepID=UPI0026ED94F1|nr:LUD domain-containing protein [Methanobrevibacter thaueri]MBE6495854.1 lactate utilization protein [Methanobrevibacter thaueri]
MKKSELETMRKSFNTVKNRSDSIKESSSTKRLVKRVQEIKKYSIEHNDELLAQLLESFERNDIECILADDSQDALKIIDELLEEYDASVVAKAKSNTLGEINLKNHLKDNGIDVVETDLGDRILQLKKVDNKPVHPTGPASHLNVSNITDIVNESLDVNVDPVPREIMEAVRKDVLNRLKYANVGISGANAIASEEGSCVMVHNEGNISIVSLKDLHIIVAGIDKIVPTLEDAISIVKLETIFATGSYVTSYMNVISGPSKTADIEKKLLKNMYGAERVVVILLDNGRSDATPECLYCIGCGNCVVHCPVYNAVGNEFGFNNYLGGRGVAMSKFIEDDETCFNSGLYMCTLCGLCTLNCPVAIPTNEIIENMRKLSTEVGFYPKAHGKIKDNVSKRDSPY